MEQAFALNKLTEPEAKELEQYITSLLMIDYNEFRKLKDEGAFKGYGMKVMNFFRLPHSALHDKYLERCRPSLLERIQQDEDNVKAEMRKKKNKFIEENNVDPNEAKYQIVKQFFTVYKLGEKDDWITIGIPYYATQSQKYKFGGTINISKNKHPNIYREVLEKFTRFNSNGEILLSLDK